MSQPENRIENNEAMNKWMEILNEYKVENVCLHAVLDRMLVEKFDHEKAWELEERDQEVVTFRRASIPML